MKSIEGIYKVEMLGPYGWENFSTAFINQGEYRSASTEHFTSGTYQVQKGGFEMEGLLTQYDDHQRLFGRKNLKALLIEFSGRIDDGVIDGEARVADGTRESRRFRLNRMAFIN